MGAARYRLGASRYKGMDLHRGKWRARICAYGQRLNLEDCHLLPPLPLLWSGAHPLPNGRASYSLEYRRSHFVVPSMRSNIRYVKIDYGGRPQSYGSGYSFHLPPSIDALAVESMETLTFRDLRRIDGQPRLLPHPSKPRFRWKWRWIVAGIAAWFLSVCLAIVAGLWLLFVLNPPGTFHEYRGVTQALFLRLWHENKITFYGPIEVSARWGNQPYWHQMTVQDLTMTINQFRKGIDAVKPVGTTSHNLETDDAIDDRHNQGPKVHLTPH
jgi:hypothetical protein